MPRIEQIFIKAKEVQVFFNSDRRTAYRMLKHIRNHYGKNAEQGLTFSEFFEYHGIKGHHIPNFNKKKDDKILQPKSQSYNP